MTHPSPKPSDPHWVFWDRLYKLRCRVEWYRQIFDSDSDTKRALDEIGHYFFRSVAASMYRDMVLDLRRLTDPASTGKRTNLSISALVERADLDVSAQRHVLEPLGAMAERLASLRKFCDKCVAHYDLHVWTTYGIPAGPTSDELVEVIEGLIETMRLLCSATGQSVHHFSLPKAAPILSVLRAVIASIPNPEQS